MVKRLQKKLDILVSLWVGMNVGVTSIVDGSFEYNMTDKIPQHDVKLYGGAQLHRLIVEFEYYAHAIEITLSDNEVQSSSGTHVRSTDKFVGY